MTPALLPLLAFPSLALAHGSAPVGPDDLWRHWSFRLPVFAGLLLFAWCYATGVRNLWLRAGAGRSISSRNVACFLTAFAVLTVALLSPLDPVAAVLFSAHMAQHLLLILVAAPLLVLGATETALIWAMPLGARQLVGRLWQSLGGTASNSAALDARVPLIAVVIPTVVLWLWHLPALYDLALSSEVVHGLEHFTFLATAVLFWSTVLRLRRHDVGNGLRVVYVFAMAVQGSILGALITLAERPLYASHSVIAPAWGVTPLSDQQIAGLLMWVPPAFLYIGVAAYLFVGWLHAVGSRAAAADERRRTQMSKQFLLVVLAALAVTACGRDRGADARRRATTAASEDIHAAGQSADQMTDAQIAALVSLINGTEIAAAKAMQPKLLQPGSRAYAERLIADHTRLLAAMPALRPSQAPPQFTTMNAIFHSQAMLLSTLPSGFAFDATFLAIQIGDHAMALDSLHRWHGATRNSGLRSAIAAAIPAVDAHLRIAKQLYGSLQRPAARDTTAADQTAADSAAAQPRTPVAEQEGP